MFKAAIVVMLSSLITYAAQAATEEPLELVARVYSQLQRNNFIDPGDLKAEMFVDPGDVDMVDPKIAQRWFTKDFLSARTKDIACSDNNKGEGVGPLWFGGNDYDFKDIQLHLVSSGDVRQKVKAVFKNDNAPEIRVFDFLKEHGVWRIDDILHDGESQKALMKKGCQLLIRD